MSQGEGGHRDRHEDVHKDGDEQKVPENNSASTSRNDQPPIIATNTDADTNTNMSTNTGRVAKSKMDKIAHQSQTNTNLTTCTENPAPDERSSSSDSASGSGSGSGSSASSNSKDSNGNRPGGYSADCSSLEESSVDSSTSSFKRASERGKKCAVALTSNGHEYGNVNVNVKRDRSKRHVQKNRDGPLKNATENTTGNGMAGMAGIVKKDDNQKKI